MLKPFTLLVLFLSIVFASCYYDNEETMYPRLNECDTTNSRFGAVIQPIIVANCQPCHNNALQSGGINLEGYNNIEFTAIHGNLLEVIRWNGPIKMPQDAKLSACNIALIEKWVRAGAQNN